ncbi:hypothetical protein [Belnapia rosea]|uniref:hypothetical protein n=1 Tax=Belnapia rosea TaxID=938405 RepID=UPI00088D5FBC|nr:hypothetical protein [Belnapia rosea]SDB71566.1 hypothetical protein SAMN02927895_04134 [Belnapia rosea]
MALKLGWKAAGAAVAVAAVGIASTAQAQTPEDIARLDRFSRDRGRALALTHQLTPPVPSGSPERLMQPERLWVCKGTQPGLPIYSSPDRTSTPMGVTQDFIATSGATVGGFVQVMGYSGRLGFVPANTLGPYINTVKPGVQCTVEGLRRRDNSPVFGFH